MPLTDWLDTEQEFTHHKLMMHADDADKKDLLKVIDMAHKNYLIYHKLFKNLLIYCARNNLHPPDLTELLQPRQVSRPE
jgi:hypothetical protein